MSGLSEYPINTYSLTIKGGCANVLIASIVGLMACVFPLLLNQDAAIFYTSMPVFFSLVVLFVCVQLMGVWGIVSALVMFLLCLVLVQPPLEMGARLWNLVANLVQIVMFVLVCYGLRKYGAHNENKYSKGEFYLSCYNLCLLGVFAFYMVSCIIGLNFKVSSVGMYCFVALLGLTILKIVHRKDWYLLAYTILIAFVPSFIGSAVSAYGTATPAQERWDYIMQWTISNYILLQTIGYIAYQILYKRKMGMFALAEHVRFSLNTVLFYVAIGLLNVAILYIIKENLLDENRYVYFFPWMFGNLFLCINLYFSLYQDADSYKEKHQDPESGANEEGAERNPEKLKETAESFNWYENRVRVVEKNMSFIITIIAFLLPLGFTSMKNIPPLAEVVFIANIFCACITLGLMWIPKERVKFMNLLMCIKTIFYLYSVTLLLICSIMIIVQIAKADSQRTQEGNALITAHVSVFAVGGGPEVMQESPCP